MILIFTHLLRTLYDSKGLEFDDVRKLTLTIWQLSDSGQVLLYNFFGDSAIDASRWQVVLNGVQGQGYVPDFYRDETRYAGICSEVSTAFINQGIDVTYFY
jgi:hypothetical protein